MIKKIFQSGLSKFNKVEGMSNLSYFFNVINGIYLISIGLLIVSFIQLMKMMSYMWANRT